MSTSVNERAAEAVAHDSRARLVAILGKHSNTGIRWGHCDCGAPLSGPRSEVHDAHIADEILAAGIGGGQLIGHGGISEREGKQ